MLFKKIWRTMGQYKAQFISMIIMIAIGIGIFVGFNMEWVTIQKNTGAFFDDCLLSDYKILTTERTGFSDADENKVKEIAGVSAASRYVTFNAEVEEKSGTSLAVDILKNETVSGLVVIDGEKYDNDSKDGIWLSESYANKNDVKIGDEITLVYGAYKINVKVKALIKAAERMVCVRDETQLMPDYSTFGYAYISPALYEEKTGVGYYPYINVRSELDKTDFKDAVNKAFGKTMLVTTKDEAVSYAASKSETQEGKTMGSVMPVIFLLIAVLTMVTTMHRLTAKEKTQIGILKALGFKDRKILRHYTSYAFMIGVIGIALGIGLGYLVCWFIMNPNGTMGTYFDMPSWKIYMPWFCWVILAVLLVLLTFIGYLSVKKMLKGTAADALQPYTPKKMKKLAIEKTKIWHKFSFGTRWNMRDIMRHKSRTLMSLIGIVGCTLLIVGSLGMSDTMNNYLKTYYNGAMNYSSRIYIAEKPEDSNKIESYESAVQKLSDTFDGDKSASIAVQLKDKNGEDKTISLDVFELKHDNVRFINENGAYIDIGDDGVYVCRRIADALNLSVGSVFKASRYGTDISYELKVAGITYSVSENIVVTDKFAEKTNIEYDIDSIYTNVSKTVVNDKKAGDETLNSVVKNVLSKQDIMDSFDSFLDLMNNMVFLLIAAGAILGMVVLYNLGVMSYTERYREMATLKVVGFKDRKIGGLLIGQNMWVTLVGVIIGIPCGVGILVFLMKALASEYELQVVVNFTTYLIGVVITFGVSLFVSLMVARKNKKIDMVESLKGAE